MVKNIGKMKKKENYEERVYALFNAEEGYFNEGELMILEEGFQCLRQLVNANDYCEAATELIIAVLTRKKDNSKLNFNEVVNEAIAGLGLVNEDDTEYLREVDKNDATYTDEVLMEEVQENISYESNKKQVKIKIKK